MKKILFFSVVLVVGFTSASWNQGPNQINSLGLLNVEVLAKGETVADCDIFIYNRNFREASEITEAKAGGGGGCYIMIGSRKVTLGIEAKVGGSVKHYYCDSSSDNCCKKSWEEKKIEYL